MWAAAVGAARLWNSGCAEHPCARARIWGEGAAFGVLGAEICLQMELLARPLDRGKGWSELMDPNFSFVRTPQFFWGSQTTTDKERRC